MSVTNQMPAAAVTPVVRKHPKLGELRLVPVAGETWFLAADVARALGMQQASSLTRSLTAAHVTTVFVETVSGCQHMLAISPPGLFQAFFVRRRNPAADELQQWALNDLLGQSAGVPVVNWGRRRTALNPNPHALTGSRISSELVRMGTPFDQAGRLGGVSRSTGYAYCNGTREPGVDFLRRMDAAGMDVLLVITGRRDATKGEASK